MEICLRFLFTLCLKVCLIFFHHFHQSKISAEMKYSKTACKIVIAPPQCGETFAEMEISSSVSVFLGQKSALKEIYF